MLITLFFHCKFSYTLSASRGRTTPFGTQNFILSLQVLFPSQPAGDRQTRSGCPPGSANAKGCKRRRPRGSFRCFYRILPSSGSVATQRERRKESLQFRELDVSLSGQQRSQGAGRQEPRHGQLSGEGQSCRAGTGGAAEQRHALRRWVVLAGEVDAYQSKSMKWVKLRGLVGFLAGRGV